MQYTFNKNRNISSTFIKEDYFPAIVEFSSEELNNHFIEFNFSDTDMFEISVNPKTRELKRFTLTLCNHFIIEDICLHGRIQSGPKASGEAALPSARHLYKYSHRAGRTRAQTPDRASSSLWGCSLRVCSR